MMATKNARLGQKIKIIFAAALLALCAPAFSGDFSEYEKTLLAEIYDMRRRRSV